MFTPKQVADSLNISATTIRNYSRLWAEYLSPSANPESGQARLYTEDDIAVMATIVALRDNQATTDQVRAALDAGERLAPMRPVEDDPAADQDPAAKSQQTADQARAAAAVAAAEKAVTIYQDRVNQLEARADQLADRLIEAERRIADERAARAAAERELEILREMYEAATSPAAPSSRPTFRQWLTGRK
jgi:DNA-binding transcriptional MerR regulator